jgi:hypothetical protein
LFILSADFPTHAAQKDNQHFTQFYLVQWAQSGGVAVYLRTVFTFVVTCVRLVAYHQIHNTVKIQSLGDRPATGTVAVNI